MITELVDCTHVALPTRLPAGLKLSLTADPSQSCTLPQAASAPASRKHAPIPDTLSGLRASMVASAFPDMTKWNLLLKLVNNF
jgi:hypothetical protein